MNFLLPFKPTVGQTTYPSLKLPHVAWGWHTSGLLHLETGEQIELYPDPIPEDWYPDAPGTKARCQAIGFIRPNIVRVLRGGKDADRTPPFPVVQTWDYDIEEKTWTPVKSYPTGANSKFSVDSNGCQLQGYGTSLWWNDQLMGDQLHWGGQMAGEWAVVGVNNADPAAVRVFRNGKEVTKEPIVLRGMIGLIPSVVGTDLYLGYRTADDNRLYCLTTGKDISVQAVPWAPECPVRVVETANGVRWIVSGTEHWPSNVQLPDGSFGPDEAYIIARPLDVRGRGLRRKVDYLNGVEVEYDAVGRQLVTVAWDVRSNMMIQGILIENALEDFQKPAKVIAAEKQYAKDMQDPAGSLMVDDVDGTTVRAHFEPAPGCGKIVAIRFLVDGVINQPADNLGTHTYVLSSGNHLLSLRVVGANGKRADILGPVVSIQAPAPMPVPEPIPVPLPPAPPKPEPVDTFLRGVNAGFGSPMPGDRLKALEDKGFTSIRTWIGAPENAQAVVRQIQQSGLKPLYIIRAGTVAMALGDLNMVPDGSLVELGNEPDIGDAPAGLPRLTPEEYAKVAKAVMAAAKAKNCVVYYGCISNLQTKNLDWLRQVLALLPAIDRVSVHRYAVDATQDPLRSVWGSRGPEMNKFLSIIGLRHFLVTEIGCQCGTNLWSEWKWVGWRPKKLWYGVDEDKALKYLKQEVSIWRGQPLCDGVYIYQEWGWPDEKYGLREASTGRWLKAGSIFQ